MQKIAMLLCVAGLAACDDDTTTMMQEGEDMTVVSVADMTVPDLAASRMRDIAVSFQPEGLWWDSATDALYIANDGGQQIVKYYEPNGAFTVFARLPDIASNAGSLGQLIKAKDGNWLTTRFGFSLAGAVLETSADGQTTTAIGGLDVKRRRIGLTQAPDGTVFDSWFTQTGTNPPAMGSVSKVALDGSGETDVVSGIAKPVGVLVLGDQLYISDQTAGVILKTPWMTPGTTTTFATVPGADELAAGPNGVIFAASKTGAVYTVATDGTATVLKSGFKPIRGVAYDADHARLFFSEPDAGSPDGGAGMPMLHIIPID